jgi:hypothetical protein
MGSATENHPAIAQTAAAVSVNKLGELSLLERIRRLEELDIRSQEEKIQGIIKARDQENISKSMTSMYLAKERVLTLPKQMFDVNEDAACAFALLSGQLGIDTYMYNSSSYENGDIPKDDLEFLRGIIYQLATKKHVSVSTKKSSFEQGRTLVAAAQVVGYFAEENVSEYLVKNQRFFSNNPGEISEDGKSKIVSLKERLPRVTKSGDTTISDILYSLLKKTHSTLSDEEKLSIRLKYTMSYGNYVNLHHKLNKLAKTSKKKKQRQEKEKVPSKPTSSSILKKEELHAITEIHSSLFTEATFMTNHKEWVHSIWDKDSRTIMVDRVSSMMKQRVAFLQQLGSLTTRRLNKLRTHLKNASKRKADITPAELNEFLSKRKEPVSDFLNEVLSLKTNQVEMWKASQLGGLDGFTIGTLNAEQRTKLKRSLFEVIRTDEFYEKQDKTEMAIIPVNTVKKAEESSDGKSGDSQIEKEESSSSEDEEFPPLIKPKPKISRPQEHGKIKIGKGRVQYEVLTKQKKSTNA